MRAALEVDLLGDVLGTGIVMVSLYSVVLGARFRPHSCAHSPERTKTYTCAEAQVGAGGMCACAQIDALYPPGPPRSKWQSRGPRCCRSAALLLPLVPCSPLMHAAR